MANLRPGNTKQPVHHPLPEYAFLALFTLTLLMILRGLLSSRDDECVPENSPLQLRSAMMSASSDRNSGSSDAMAQISVSSDVKSAALSEDMDVILRHHQWEKVGSFTFCVQS